MIYPRLSAAGCAKSRPVTKRCAWLRGWVGAAALRRKGVVLAHAAQSDLRETVRRGSGQRFLVERRWLDYAALGMLLWAGACRIEKVLPPGDDAAVPAPAVTPSAPRYSTDDTPLTPFRGLLQGAFSPEAPADEGDDVQQRAPSRVPLPGVQLIAVGPNPKRTRVVLRDLCEQIRGGSEVVPAVTAAVMQLECTLPAQLGRRSEAITVVSTGAWGAALAVAAGHSATSAAQYALTRQLGLVVWGEMPRIASPPHDPEAAIEGELHCPDAPPISLMATDTQAAAAVGETSVTASTVGASQVLQDEPTDPLVPGGATPQDLDAGVPEEGDEEPLAVPALVWVGVRTAQGEFVAGLSGLAPNGESQGAAGRAALPGRRMMVGADGAVLVDPALLRQVEPDPLAAMRAYERVVSGQPREEDTVALLNDGPLGSGSPYVQYLHVTETLDSSCGQGDTE